MKRVFRILVLLVLGLWTGGNAMAEDHYLVGGCTASGWNAGAYNRSPVAMVNVSENVWVWAGKLTTGDGDDGRFKIPDSDGGWDGYWAPAQGTVLTSEWSDLSTNSSGDYKYCVAEEGVYRVTINTNTQKIKAEKLTEPSKDGDYYLIGSVNDYYWYAGTVTSGEQALKARLTANLDFATVGFFPLACDKFKFKGEFDGAGYSISNAVIVGSNNNVAFVRYATGGADIHDLVVEGSFEGSAKIGGIIGFARDGGEVKLTNVINKATVKSTGNTDANAAGLFGCAVDGTKVTATNCANMGEVRGQDGNCAAFAGWTQSGTTFTNCWNSGAIYNMENNCNLYRNTGAVSATNCWDASGNDAYTQGTMIAPATIASGEFCYKLNGDQSEIHWYQNLAGTVDDNPVPFSAHSQVYANGQLKCDGTSAGGELTYSNESSSVIPPHTNENGWCSVCGALDHDYLSTDADGYYSIGTANDLHWFAAMVEEVNQSAKAKLTANIDYSDFKQGFIGVSQSLPFRGVFDGQGNTITIDIVNNGTGRTGLFAYINAATIRNLVVEGSATSAGNNCVGGLGGRSDGSGTLIENVVVNADVSYTGTNGDATCGGLFANMESTVTVKNCAFYGSINTGSAEGNGGLVGWAGGGANVKFENCIVAPTSYTQNGNSADFARNNPTADNCFKVANDDARLASGEMTWELNKKVSGGTDWYQLIGTDAYPMPFGTAIVYANGQLYCDGMPKPGSAFENEEKDVVQDNHTYSDWGFCTNSHDGITCDALQPDYVELADGFYQVGEYKQLNWFAVLVNRGETTAKAQLTADIDKTEYADNAYPGIGTSDHPFRGVFDGQGHHIRNLSMNLNEDAVGFFRYVTSGGTVIKRFTIDSTCSFYGNSGVGAFVGQAKGRNGDRDLLFEELGNEAPVTANGNNAAGILGVDMNSDCIITMKNCYNVGDILGNSDNGGLSGWMGDNAITENCYNNGDVSGSNTESFGRGNGIQITNCFDPATNWPALPSSPAEDFSNGVIFAKLFDADPVWYMEFTEPAHPVLYETALVLNENFPNRFVAAEGVDLTLERTIYADGEWETVCLPFSLDATQVEDVFGAGTKLAELTGSEGETLEFSTVTALEAGTPYLLLPTVAFTSKELEGVTLVAGEPTAVAEAGLAFTGVYEPTKIDQGDLFIAAGNKLKPSDGESAMKAFRAYFDVVGEGSGAKMFVVDEAAGGATGIVRADGSVETLDEVYTISGVRVNKPTRGLYIINGKKTVIK